MIRKKDLLANINKYTPQEIADAVNGGVVTLYELGHDTGGAFTPLLRHKVKDILSNSASSSNQNQNNITQPSPSVPQSHTDVNEDSYKVSETVEVNKPSFNFDQNDTSSSMINNEDASVNSTNPSGGRMFSNPFSFKGRIRRTEYGISYIIYLVWNIIVSLSDDNNPNIGIIIFCLVTLIPMMWFLWAQGCKRCHDLGHSGWFQLIPFYFLWMLFSAGDKGENEYGPDPKK